MAAMTVEKRCDKKVDRVVALKEVDTEPEEKRGGPMDEESCDIVDDVETSQKTFETVEALGDSKHQENCESKKTATNDNSVKVNDVLIPSWTGGRDTALDVTVVSP